jgi:hypothetical protein
MTNIAQSLIKFENDTHSIRHQVEMQPSEAVEFCQGCQGINEATNKNLTRFVKSVNEMIPAIKFDDGNPNNGRSHHTFIVGQECSRVIYVTFAKYYLKGYNWTGQEYNELERLLKNTASRFNADEMCVTENDEHSFTFRAWWD